MTDDTHLTAAIEQALASMAAGGGPFGSVVVRGAQVLGRGANRVVPAHDPTAHAEIVAIRGACETLGSHLLRGCTLYASCEPCPMCRAAIHWARIERVVFACGREDAARSGFDDARLYGAFTGSGFEASYEQRARTQGLEVFRVWDATPDRTSY